MRKWPLVASMVLLGTLAGAVHAQSTITVDTTADVVARNGVCSLREAIIASNENRSADSLSESCAGSAVNDLINFRAGNNPVINVATALPIILEQVTITGPAARVTIHGPGFNDGIVISSTAPGTVVSRLAINGWASGIQVNGAGSVITGNYIGTNAAGTAAVANQYGIKVLANFVRIGGTTGVTPGGPCTGDCNVIAASTDMGIRVESGVGIEIQGNFIGTNAAGTAAFGNAHGIALLNGSTATIGGTTAAASNLISGSQLNGISIITQQDSSGSSIVGNRIGTNAAGTAAFPNNVGINVILSGRNYPLVIGGATPGSGNLIAGNTDAGIRLWSTSHAIVRGNLIGTQSNGVSPLGNGGQGIDLLADLAGSSSQNAIGGFNAGAGNVIAFNAVGVQIHAGGPNGGSRFNTIIANSIHDNAGKGIQLDDGQALTVVTPDITGLNPVTGLAGGCSGCRIDIYSDSADEGRKWEGVAVVPANGTWTFPGPVDGPYVTATATTNFNSTSEFSAPFFEDTDGDGLSDSDDNCLLVANANQRDTNADGYGNVCDADLDNTGLVTVQDFNLFRTVLNQVSGSSALAAAADFDGSGLVTVQDYVLLRSRLNQAPGPSGLSCAGTIPCGTT